MKRKIIYTIIISANWSEMKMRILIGSLSDPKSLQYGPLRWTGNEAAYMLPVKSVLGMSPFYLNQFYPNQC